MLSHVWVHLLTPYTPSTSTSSDTLHSLHSDSVCPHLRFLLQAAGVTRLIYTYVLTHSYVRHDSLTCDDYVRLDSSCCSLQVWHALFLRMFWCIHVRGVTHSCVVILIESRALLQAADMSWLIYARALMHSCVWHDSLMCGDSERIMCAAAGCKYVMTYLCVCFDALMCVAYLINARWF